ncbi:conjugal transfer protein TrbC [Verminephrobacter aporrectodeae subsp. tuberculatae]|uniref:Conjugal transfer protein TrbC n=1 Tax=Verminephrobacter aporrectodeae subsp. tuberculatae TaxID=1110392 RepID=A0ABT3KZE1_9BURK|nr:TrbC/VirB2 family protein [Verminephrobacter aporrectodeae]MCW5323682.1 conjugal transfer protein TrbC [Verminephrobacter aporrectodeae subsp. tuberculatae]
MNAAIQAIDVRKEAGQWFKAFMLAGLILGLMMLASGAYASDGTEFASAVTKWDGWVKGNLGKLAALIAIGVGSVVAAVKKDWSWFFGAVVLSMGIGVLVGIVNASFTAVI